MTGETPDGKIETMWHPMWRPRDRDAVTAGHDVITRLALLTEGLSWGDLRNPPTFMDAHHHRRVRPAHQKKVDAFEQKRREYLRKWVSPRSSSERKKIAKLLSDMKRANIMQAAQYLALYHCRFGIPMMYKTLACVLGIAKSSLYRQYGRELIQGALQSACSAAVSPTQEMIKTRHELDGR